MTTIEDMSDEDARDYFECNNAELFIEEYKQNQSF